MSKRGRESIGWGGCSINNDGGDSDKPSATKTFYTVHIGHWKLHEITITITIFNA